jgi:hypothetical protein
MRGARERWLLGVDPGRARLGAAALAVLAGLLGGLGVLAGPQPDARVLLAVLAAPPLAGLAYAAWNGGPMLAVPATQVPGIAALVQGPGSAYAGAYAVVTLPAGLAAFALAAWHADRRLHAPEPLGEGRLGRALLLLWLVGVLLAAWFHAGRPDVLAGPRVWGSPEWVRGVQALSVWGPAGLALGYAVARRGPALAFLLASAPAWSWYLARWLGAQPWPGPAYLGDALFPGEVDAVRGTALVALALAATLLAVAFEPAWPWSDTEHTVERHQA